VARRRRGRMDNSEIVRFSIGTSVRERAWRWGRPGFLLSGRGRRVAPDMHPRL
jgi:hypothetical protein